MILNLFILLAAFIVLLWGADRFVIGAAAFARNLGLSPLLVGLTIVAIGTSGPEIFVGIIAALKGNPGIAIGNAIGSNITNIGLVIGLTALIIPLQVRSVTLKREYPLLFVVMLLVAILSMDGSYSRFDGLLLTSSWVITIGIMIFWGLSADQELLFAEFAKEIPKKMPTCQAIGWLGLGLVLLPLGSDYLVNSAVAIAKDLGISELVIGLTVVALGTSLPELMASLMSAIRGEHDIAIGNILGSNLFNLLAVIGLPSLIHPYHFGPNVLYRDFPIMLLVTILLYVASYWNKQKPIINRKAGFLLLLVYCAYIGFTTSFAYQASKNNATISYSNFTEMEKDA